MCDNTTQDIATIDDIQFNVLMLPGLAVSQ